MTTSVINIHHNLPYDQYIGRGKDSIWGNPFSYLDSTLAEFKAIDRDDAVAKHRAYLLKNPKLLLMLHTLKGKKLGCFCAPHACHGDTYVDLIENCYWVIIAGGREFKDYEMLRARMDQLLSKKAKEYKIIIVSGRARGADQLGERYARERGYEIAEFAVSKEEWAKSKGAGHKRNNDMAQMPRMLQGAAAIFWDGSSHGSKSMIDICQKYGINHRVELY